MERIKNTPVEVELETSGKGGAGDPEWTLIRTGRYSGSRYQTSEVISC